MAARQKAEQFIKDFGSLESTTFDDGYPNTTSIESIYLSKQCALIAVNKIIEALRDVFILEADDTDIDEQLAFWKAVKIEIEKI